MPDDDLAAAVRNLGGHDLGALRDAYGAIDDTRPTVIIAYTLKGYGLAIEGHPQNHSALLTEAQLRRAGRPARPRPGRPVGRLPGRQPGRRGCWPTAADRLPRPDAAAESAARPCRPTSAAPRTGTATTQAALGRTLLDLNRAAPEVGERVVTVSPDVSSRPTSAAG